jgi:hypothetical protein
MEKEEETELEEKIDIEKIEEEKILESEDEIEEKENNSESKLF